MASSTVYQVKIKGENVLESEREEEEGKSRMKC